MKTKGKVELRVEVELVEIKFGRHDGRPRAVVRLDDDKNSERELRVGDAYEVVATLNVPVDVDSSEVKP